jgi:hypothetical protein
MHAPFFKNLLKLDISIHYTYYLETQRAQGKKYNYCPTELSLLASSLT